MNTESSISVMHLDGYIKLKVTVENNLKPIKLYSRPSSQRLCLDSSTYRNQWVSWHSSEEILTEKKKKMATVKNQVTYDRGLYACGVESLYRKLSSL
jgi:hypothetical protein